MSVDLRAAAADHLAHRRARGYRLADHGWLLGAFLDALHARGHTTITVADAMAFAQAQPATGRLWQATRLRAVRGLAAHVHEETANELPFRAPSLSAIDYTGPAPREEV